MSYTLILGTSLLLWNNKVIYTLCWSSMQSCRNIVSLRHLKLDFCCWPKWRKRNHVFFHLNNQKTIQNIWNHNFFTGDDPWDLENKKVGLVLASIYWFVRNSRLWVRKGKPMWGLANCVEKMEFRVQIDQDSYSSEDREPEKREEGREKSQRWHECMGGNQSNLGKESAEKIRGNSAWWSPR